jgi:hypothetical protein
MFRPDAALRTKIGTYFTSIIGKQRVQIASRLPDIMPRWGKMRIRNGGDLFRSSVASRRTGGRDMSYIRVIHLTIELTYHTDSNQSSMR